MILQIFAIRDRATDQFGNPMQFVSHGQAIRSFTDEVNRSEKDNNLYQHPDDFDLYFLGSYDSSTGLYVTQAPAQIAIGKNVKLNGK